MILFVDVFVYQQHLCIFPVKKPINSSFFQRLQSFYWQTTCPKKSYFKINLLIFVISSTFQLFRFKFIHSQTLHVLTGRLFVDYLRLKRWECADVVSC